MDETQYFVIDKDQDDHIPNKEALMLLTETTFGSPITLGT